MRDPVPISDLPPVPWVRERDVDLLLAELLSTEPSLTSWLLQQDRRHSAEIPVGTPSAVRAIVNYSRPDATSEGAGETDVVVEADYPDDAGALVLSIEDKVWAAPQRNQGRRHRAFVEGHPSRWGLAVLIGPKEWISGHPDEADEYHLCACLEDIAEDWCKKRDFAFQASVFLQACVPPAVVTAPDLQVWHTAVDSLFDEEFGIRLAPQRFVRTSSEGQAKPNRWVACESGTLTDVRGAEKPWIILEPASTNYPSRAAVEMVKAPTELIEHVSTRAMKHGFAVRVTRAGTLLIEQYVPEATRWTIAAGFDEQIVALRAIGQAVIKLRDWWNPMVVELHLAAT